MQAELFATPPVLNMGFHYTAQYSRRTRINVLGQVDQSGDDWRRWYENTHRQPALQAMADAGYTLIEIHFLYGFGLKGEREEWERTREMTANAHAVGLKVLGYFQFFSVQQETFFLENPWAEDCLQLDAAGKRLEYHYDRPALCFTDPRVRQYYLDGIRLGLIDCDLDGIRLDNDYFKGCYCARCQAAFRDFLADNFPADRARRVFGLSTVAGMALPARQRGNDPLWLAMVYFRQQQRQAMMRLLSRHVLKIKPHAVLGGNPAVGRRFDEPGRIHVYPPDLGETHHLVCAENRRFPARTGETIRHQALLYKYGQAHAFAVFPSCHLHTPAGLPRWPETREECALSFCEALAFGGHPVCTTWGIRMDGAVDRTLYQRPLFLRALAPVAAFIRQHPHVYRQATCNAPAGIYQNRASLCADALNAALSLHGTVQILMQNQIPFQLFDLDCGPIPDTVKLVIIPDMQLISAEHVTRLTEFAAQGGRLLVTGASGRFDEWRLPREPAQYETIWDHPRICRLSGTPEKTAGAEENEHRPCPGGDTTPAGCDAPPTSADEAACVDAIRAGLPPPSITVQGSRYAAVDTFVIPDGRRYAHLLNYDNAHACDLTATLLNARNIGFYMPAELGAADMPEIATDGDATIIRIHKLHTYMVIGWNE